MNRRARQTGWNLVGIGVFCVMVFPVFWMLSTAFKSNDQIVSLNPTWFPLHPTLVHFRDAIDRPYFWTDVRNSVVVVSITVAISYLTIVRSLADEGAGCQSVLVGHRWCRSARF